MAVALQMEKEIKKPPPAPGGLDEDQAMAAFSEFVSNGGGIIDKADPIKMAAKKKKKDDLAAAQNELKDLQSNDATAAFAGLVESQVIETKASTYEGSGQLSAKAALAEAQNPKKA